MQMFWERGRRLAQAVRARAGRVFCGALALWVGVMAFSPQRNIPTTLTGRTPILIDCDPGGDDVLAIGLAAGTALLDVRGITLCSGAGTLAQTGRSGLTAATYFDLHCPVALGSTRNSAGEAVVWGEDTGPTGAGNLVLPFGGEEDFDPRPAWELMYETAVQEGGALQILCLGPLTNLARALEEHPDQPQYIQRVVFSAGSVSLTENGAVAGVGSDANGPADPAALQKVLASGIPLVMIDASISLGDHGTQKDLWTLFASQPRLFDALWSYWDEKGKRNFAAGTLPLDGIAAVSLLIDETTLVLKPADLGYCEGPVTGLDGEPLDGRGRVTVTSAAEGGSPHRVAVACATWDWQGKTAPAPVVLLHQCRNLLGSAAAL